MNGQKYVHIGRLHPHPRNIRENLGDLAEMAASVAVHGVLQPIVVEPHPSIPNAYQVLAGHRRLEAARLAGREQVPIVVRQTLPGVEPEELMLVEDWHRADLEPMEKAKAMGALRAKGYTASRIAHSVGLSQSAVSFYLALLELDPATQKRVRSGALTAADAVADVRRRVREPDCFTDRHRLARSARALCDAQDHAERCRIGMVACGQCWETVIREDEQYHAGGRDAAASAFQPTG